METPVFFKNTERNIKRRVGVQEEPKIDFDLKTKTQQSFETPATIYRPTPRFIQEDLERHGERIYIYTSKYKKCVYIRLKSKDILVTPQKRVKSYCVNWFTVTASPLPKVLVF